MIKKNKKDSQGSLEYLIIVAAVLAIAAIAVLFLTGAFQSTSGDISACKLATSQCNNDLATAEGAVCSNCVDSCPAELVSACQKGKTDEIYLGALGSGDSGVDVTFTDSPGTAKSVTMTVIKIEAEREGEASKILFSGARDVLLEEGVVQSLLTKKIPGGRYNTFRIYLADTAKVKDYLGNQFTANVANRMMTVDINKELAKDEILHVLIDIPVADALQFDEVADKYSFQPALKPFANNGIEQGILTQEEGTRILNQDEALLVMERAGYTRALQKGNAGIEAFISVPFEQDSAVQRLNMKINKIELVQEGGIAKTLLIAPAEVIIQQDTTSLFLSRAIPATVYTEMRVYFEPVADIKDNSGVEYLGHKLESRMIKVNLNKAVVNGETLKVVVSLSIEDMVRVGAVEESPFRIGVPERPSAATGIEQTPFKKKSSGILTETETSDLFFVIGPGIGEMFA